MQVRPWALDQPTQRHHQEVALECPLMHFIHCTASIAHCIKLQLQLQQNLQRRDQMLLQCCCFCSAAAAAADAASPLLHRLHPQPVLLQIPERVRREALRVAHVQQMARRQRTRAPARAQARGKLRWEKICP